MPGWPAPMTAAGRQVPPPGIKVMSLPAHAQKVAVIGGGFTGALFALKLAAARPDWTILLVESRAHAGRGVAYGDCAPQHLLNVPAARMEVGLKPGFVDWLRERPEALREALDESKGVLGDAYVPRRLFGDYIEQRLAEVLRAGGIRRVFGEAVGVTVRPRQIVLADGSRMAVDKIVLATGNPPSHLPFAAKAPARVIDDPWATDALDPVQPDDSLLLLGTGLTMIDIFLLLRQRGHKGPVHAVSRHGLLPKSHRAGGQWPAFLDPAFPPRAALRAIRDNVRRAEARGVPWQRVFDAARPMAASLWHGWSLGQRAQFLRHLRTLWDVHRHRMAERVAAVVNDARWNGSLTVTAGRLRDVTDHPEGLTVLIQPRGAKALSVEVDTIINCTGPATDLRRIRHPLLKDLLGQGLIRADLLGLGLDTDDCAALGADGTRSNWLFALGALTRPAWWEITAVPEIRAQAERLAARFRDGAYEGSRPLAAVFLDIGAGI